MSWWIGIISNSANGHTTYMYVESCHSLSQCAIYYIYALISIKKRNFFVFKKEWKIPSYCRIKLRQIAATTIHLQSWQSITLWVCLCCWPVWVTYFPARVQYHARRMAVKRTSVSLIFLELPYTCSCFWRWYNFGLFWRFLKINQN